MKSERNKCTLNYTVNPCPYISRCKNKPSKTAIENAPIMDQIYNEILTDEAVTASTVAEAIGVSPQKATALLRALVADGRAEATEVKVPKKGAQKAYTKVVAETAEPVEG
jgi:hypothetical protein